MQASDSKIGYGVQCIMQATNVTQTKPSFSGAAHNAPAGMKPSDRYDGPAEDAWRTFRELLLESVATNEWFQSSSSPPDMVAGLVEMVQHALIAASCTVFLVSGHGHQLLYNTLRTTIAPRAVTHARTDALNGPAAWVVQHRTPLVLNDVSDWDLLKTEQDEPLEGLDARILCVPVTADGTLLGALEVRRGKAEEPFSERDVDTAQIIGTTAGIVIENTRLRQTIEEGYRSTIRALASAIDAKDPYTCGHSQSVAQYSMIAGLVLNLDAAQMWTLETAALLHDIGKIGIDDEILRKPRKLSPTEQGKVRDHPVIGAAIVHDIVALQEAVGLILYHHERFDGSGYPHRISGEDIPLGARIIGVADAFDSMTTDRPYRRAMTINEAMSELLRCRGTQFCPQALDAFAIGFTRYYDDLPRRPRILERPDRFSTPIR